MNSNASPAKAFERLLHTRQINDKGRNKVFNEYGKLVLNNRAYYIAMAYCMLNLPENDCINLPENHIQNNRQLSQALHIVAREFNCPIPQYLLQYMFINW